ncbi:MULTISPECIES: glycosyltransferase [unclassified Duganella]|uniref:O-linked N-acetylglucosamine transferase family protein n=1 Tax=unclassified Duganella TaxID=2636909 RepID=UPI000B8732CC|nr:MULTISPECIES: glycosyltransferase [unclassified Duganella]
MSHSVPSEPSPLQELNRALAANELARASSLAFALARQGELPIVELFGLAGLLGQAGDAARAAELYHLWLRCTDTPLLYAGWYNLAVLQMQNGDQREAEPSLRAALAIKPDFLDARLALGALQERLQQPEAALATWRAALAQIDPELPASRPQQLQALNHLGRLAAARRLYGEAEEALARSLLLDPRQPAVIAQWLQLRQQQCAWPVYAPLPGLREADLAEAASPATALDSSDDPALHLAAARRHSINQAAAPAAPLAGPHGYAHHRLRLGYLCADFGADGAARLAAGLYRLHDRERFEVYGFSWSSPPPPDAPASTAAASALAPAALAGLDHHIDLAGMGDLQAAQTLRAHEIDILIDLHGLDEAGRPGIVALRPAPVQIAAPGLPASSAMPAVDHVLADAFVLPPALAPHFTEQPLYLPHCAQFNARLDQPAEAAIVLTRAACGLPPEGMVFCCFHPQHQITPQQFGSWMRILQRSPGSVLWLGADSEPVRDNLRLAALRHGVASAALVFAAPATPAVMQARCQLADLYLDTAPRSGAIGASDALWAGLPVLTRAGRSYASRSAGSLLHAAGLPELVTHSERSYEDRAVRLATRPKELARLRNRLLRKRDKLAWFDAPAQVRALEQLYWQVARRSPAEAGIDTDVDVDTGAAAHGPAPCGKRDASLPLVSLLVANHASGAAAAAALEQTVRSALAQDYGHFEIIVSDSSGDDACRRRLAPLLKRQPQLRYHRAPALAPADNLDHSLALALGQYIAVAPPGEQLDADKLSRMMRYYHDYPALGLVACWRQACDADGAPLAGAPLLPGDTALGGASLAALLLSDEHGAGGALCEPAALLLRRDDLGAGFGHYQGKRYTRLAGIATLLASLNGRDCAYIAAPLSHYAPAGETAPAGIDSELELALERLTLLYEAHTRQHYLPDHARYKALLATRLAALATLATQHHAALATAALARREAIQQALRQGYHLLLE